MRGAASAAVFALAVALPAAATPILKASTETYRVTGATESEVRQSLDKSPLMPDGRRRIGYTQPDIRWQTESRARGGICRVVSVTVTVTAVVTLPSWEAPAGASAALRKSWTRFLDALTAHEQGHVDIAVATARKIESAIWRLPAPKTCTGITVQIDAIANKIFDAAIVEQNAYDDATDFGATQGVKFP